MAQLTQYSDVVEDVWAYLDALARRCGDAGLYPWNVWLDPGLGFAKTPDQSVECPGGLWQHSLAIRGVGRDRCTSCCTEMMPHPPEGCVVLCSALCTGGGVLRKASWRSLRHTRRFLACNASPAAPAGRGGREGSMSPSDWLTTSHCAVLQGAHRRVIVHRHYPFPWICVQAKLA